MNAIMKKMQHVKANNEPKHISTLQSKILQTKKQLQNDHKMTNIKIKAVSLYFTFNIYEQKK